MVNNSIDCLFLAPKIRVWCAFVIVAMTEKSCLLLQLLLRRRVGQPGRTAVSINRTTFRNALGNAIYARKMRGKKRNIILSSLDLFVGRETSYWDQTNPHCGNVNKHN